MYVPFKVVSTTDNPPLYSEAKCVLYCTHLFEYLQLYQVGTVPKEVPVLVFPETIVQL